MMRKKYPLDTTANVWLYFISYVYLFGEIQMRILDEKLVYLMKISVYLQ